MIRVRASFSGLSGGTGVMTIYGRDLVNENDAAADLLATNMKSAIDAVKSLYISTSVTFSQDGSADVINPATGAKTGVLSTTPWTDTGGSSDIALPPATQGLVHWSTGVYTGGREIVGRTFVPGLTTFASQAGGVAKAAFITAMTSFVTAWLDSHATTTAIGVWHRPKAGGGGAFEPAVAGTTRTKFAVLRSRRD